MMKRAAFLLLAAGLLSTTSGCGVIQALVYCPFGDGGPVLRRGCCCEGPCGPACGPCGGCEAPCGPACGPCNGPACGPACGACQTPCGPACGPCNGAVCGPHRACCDCCDCECGNGCGPHPLRWLWGLFDWNCDCGCGEKYWGDWSDPPDCHDPCDRCGHYVGRGCYGGNCGPGPGYPPGTIQYGPPVDDPSAANRPPQVAPQPDRAVAQGDPSASAYRVASRSQYNPSSYGPPQRPVYRYYYQGQYQNQSQGQGPSQGQYQYQ